MKQEKKGISGSSLKLIAITVMFVDHIAAVILDRILMSRGLEKALQDVNEMAEFIRINNTLYIADVVMRMIGRLGFPIFCFLLVEGFLHTRNMWKYAGRLAVFALISELPFDLAVEGIPFSMRQQNVFMTLLLGLLVLIVFRLVELQEKMPNILRLIIYAVALGAGMGIANLLKTDYMAFGVVAIVVLYLCRKKKSIQVTAGCVMFCWEITAPVAFIPIAFYNGERGLNLKYAFYAFYPLHLLLLYFISVLLGLPTM